MTVLDRSFAISMTPRAPHRWLRLVLCAVLLPPVAAAAPPAVDFSHDVAPILETACVPCHGGGKAEGDFSLNTRDDLMRAEVVKPGKASESRLWQLVRSSDPDDQMPPAGKPRLTKQQIDTLAAWIDAGLSWEPGFSFAKDEYEPPLRPRRPQLPPVANGLEHPVDRFVAAYFTRHEIDWPPELDDAAFLRRVSLDLIGLPPTPEELQEFLADPALEKRREWIGRLLQRNPEYAAHWMTYWNDLLRNSYSGTGYIDGGRKQITEWLYGSLLHNKPYDAFVRELLSPSAKSEGFIRGIKWRGNVNASQRREIQFAQSISQVMLGINMKCASCHDSFIDRWTLRDAYGLAAIYAERPLEIFRCDKPTGELATPAWIFPELGQITASAPQPERLEQLAQLMTHPQNGRLTRTIVNRFWRQLMGRGIVHPVDAMHTRPFDEDLLDYLSVEFADHGYNLKWLLEFITTSRIYQSQAVVWRDQPTEPQYRFRGPFVKRMTAEQYLDSIRSIGGVWPSPPPRALKPDGRQQGGQLAAVLRAEGKQEPWGDRPVRTVFTFTDELQASLGRPNREQIVTVRPETFTTLEAIQLANGEFLSQLLDEVAASLLSRKAPTRELVDRLFLHALSRPPSPDEVTIALELLGEQPDQQRLADLLWSVFLLPEFQFVR